MLEGLLLPSCVVCSQKSAVRILHDAWERGDRYVAVVALRKKELHTGQNCPPVE
jgi:hypothetical protein